jgi:hypothetical protein
MGNQDNQAHFKIGSAGIIALDFESHRIGNIRDKRKGPRTKAPFTSHHPLPPKRSFNEYLIHAGFKAVFIGKS